MSPADRPDPVWWCDNADAWRTRFPPPDFFMGEEDGEWGDPDYQRELDDGEIEQIERSHRIQSAVRHITEGRTRDRWFADAARLDPDDDDEQPRPPEPVQPSDDQAGETPMTVPPCDDHAEHASPEPSTCPAVTAHDEADRPIAEPAPTHPAAIQLSTGHRCARRLAR